MYIYVYIYIYMYIYIYIHVYIYIYMQLIVQQWQPQQSSHPVDVQPSHLPHLMHQEQVGHKVSMMLGSNPPFIWTLVSLEWMHSMGIKAVAGKQSHTTPFSGWFNFSLIPSMSSYNWDHATTNWCFRTEKWIVSTFTISPWPQSCCFLNKFVHLKPSLVSPHSGPRCTQCLGCKTVAGKWQSKETPCQIGWLAIMMLPTQSMAMH